VKKMAKLQKEAEAADQAYQQSVPKSEAARLQWEEEMTQACHTFEGAEWERIGTLKVPRRRAACGRALRGRALRGRAWQDRLTEYVVMMDRLHQSYRTIADSQRTYMECIKPEVRARSSAVCQPPGSQALRPDRHRGLRDLPPHGLQQAGTDAVRELLHGPFERRCLRRAA
jgi:hypothetical protein